MIKSNIFPGIQNREIIEQLKEQTKRLRLQSAPPAGGQHVLPGNPGFIMAQSGAPPPFGVPHQPPPNFAGKF